VPVCKNAHVAYKQNQRGTSIAFPKTWKRYRLAPFVRYDFARLAETNQSYPATIDYSVRVNGVDLGKEMLSIRIRSVNKGVWQRANRPESYQGQNCPMIR
jgi:hypothetical protein